MAEIPQKRDFLAWSIQNFTRKVKQFVWKYYITWIINLANKLYDVEKFFISFYTKCYWKLSCFIKKSCNQTYYSVNLWLRCIRKVRMIKNDQNEWKAFF